MGKNTISIYAEGVYAQSDSDDSLLVTIKGFDLSNLLSELNVDDVLDSLVANDQGQAILDFVDGRLKEEE